MQVANVAHAAGESAPTRVPHGTIAVVLAARDEAHLADVAGRLELAGIPLARVIEGDGAYAGQLMALGIEPTRDRARVGKVVSSLPLVK